MDNKYTSPCFRTESLKSRMTHKVQGILSASPGSIFLKILSSNKDFCQISYISLAKQEKLSVHHFLTVLREKQVNLKNNL